LRLETKIQGRSSKILQSIFFFLDGIIENSFRNVEI